MLDVLPTSRKIYFALIMVLGVVEYVWGSVADLVANEQLRVNDLTGKARNDGNNDNKRKDAGARISGVKAAVIPTNQ